MGLQGGLRYLYLGNKEVWTHVYKKYVLSFAPPPPTTSKI